MKDNETIQIIIILNSKTLRLEEKRRKTKYDPYPIPKKLHISN